MLKIEVGMPTNMDNNCTPDMRKHQSIELNVDLKALTS